MVLSVEGSILTLLNTLYNQKNIVRCLDILCSRSDSGRVTYVTERLINGVRVHWSGDRLLSNVVQRISMPDAGTTSVEEPTATGYKKQQTRLSSVP